MPRHENSIREETDRANGTSFAKGLTSNTMCANLLLHLISKMKVSQPSIIGVSADVQKMIVDEGVVDDEIKDHIDEASKRV